MSDSVKVNGVVLTRKQVEDALKELNAPPPGTVPLLKNTKPYERAFLFPEGHPMHMTIQIRDTHPNNLDENEYDLDQHENGLYLWNLKYTYSLEPTKGGDRFLRVTKR